MGNNVIRRSAIGPGKMYKDDNNIINLANIIKDVFADQAGRVRTSSPEPLGDYKLVNDRLPQFFDTVTNGTAAVTYSAERKAHDMQTSADGDWAIVQTWQRHNYFAGKAQYIEFTSFEFGAQDNVVKESGYYSSNLVTPFNSNIDGFYLNTKNGTHYLTIENNGFVILDLPRDQWDDPLDGTGASRFRINWDNFNVFEGNFLWLGGTGLRLSVKMGSSSFLVHEYDHINSANADKLIFASPNKPVRHVIRQTGAGAGQFMPVCSTVASEGSESTANISDPGSIDTGASDLIEISAGTHAMIKGLRLKTTHIDTIVDILGIETFVETPNDFYRWSLVLNPVVTGTPEWADVPGYPIQETTGNGLITISGGRVWRSGYGSSRTVVDTGFQQARKIGVGINGTREELYLTMEPITGSINLNCFGEIAYRYFV